MSEYILSIDQGTSSSRALLFDKQAKVVAKHQQEFTQFYPQNSWVEHDAEEIWKSIENVISETIKKAGIKPQQIKSIGITNQRETTVVWNKETGKPVYNAIVWQSCQTENICKELKEKKLNETVKAKTGLLIDAYFSGPKITWILRNVKGAREQADKGQLFFGTIDTWLLWKLTSGKSHATDYSNASRTMIFNINTLNWDKELLESLEIPESMLPEVKESASDFGETNCSIFGEAKIPICGIAGDQQAALFGHQCIEAGEVKNTYGTGCFMLMNVGPDPIFSDNGLLTTIACDAQGKPCYALEGSVFVAGSAVQWLRDGLKIIKESSETEKMAQNLKSSDGVVVVPAFVGLGTPYWNSDVRGAVFGLTRDSGRKHLARATLESIAYQCRDLLNTMEKDTGLDTTSLKVDGGATANKFLMQFQADLLQIEISLPVNSESTVIGAAFLAGLSSGFWTSKDLKEFSSKYEYIDCDINSADEMNLLYDRWKKAVAAAISFH
ncbi:MAG: glycerol kinase GlpK [Lentisphaeraceae bacterium]|nr:glycerol kinase GlpK [Lentisphaeraceae bacterium]